jgi:hypothetical protein
MFRCLLCNKILESKTKFENHAKEVHGISHYTNTAATNYNKNNTINEVFADKSDNKVESMLLEKTAKEEKTRKRTRGPYRKSVSPASS